MERCCENYSRFGTSCGTSDKWRPLALTIQHYLYANVTAYSSLYSCSIRYATAIQKCTFNFSEYICCVDPAFFSRHLGTH
ncbi:hypothetical protein M8J75_000347 [Diaphorina citri]|nr:hypothetical protein M8J75_000347 [Diaphorina citri]